ncbi:MAG: helix-turn-helix domain-containing protein [Thermodesulfobacteriota bacterium]
MDKGDIAKKMLGKATEMGYDAVTIANALKIKPQTVEEWLSGKRLPRPSNLIALASLLNIPLSFLKKGINVLTDIPTYPYQLIKEIFSEISKAEAEELEVLIRLWKGEKTVREILAILKQMKKSELEEIRQEAGRILQLRQLVDDVAMLKKVVSLK